MCGWQLELLVVVLVLVVLVQLLVVVLVLVQLLVLLLVVVLVVVRCFDVQHDAAQLPHGRRGGVDLDVAADQSDVGWTAE